MLQSDFRKIALGWDDFLLNRVADRFYETCLGADNNDLGGFLLIVPTAEAGRLVREKIAERFSHRGGVFSLRVETPSYLITPPFPCASETLVSANWLDTLKSIDPKNYPGLLKGLDKYRGNTRWLAGIASKLQQCRISLAAEGLSVGAVREIFECLSKEKGAEDLWNRSFQFGEFERLEECYLSKFTAAMPDPVQAELSMIARPLIPPDIEHIIFAGCPDPLPAAMFAAENLAKNGIDVELWIAAAQDAFIYFDSFGRPDVNYWENQTLDINIRANVRRMKKPEDAAEKILSLYSENIHKPSAVGILDNDITESVREKILCRKNSDFKFYIPQKIKLSTLPFTSTMLSLLELACENPSFELIARLARNPFVMNYCLRKRGFSNWSELLIALDRLQNEHLLNDFMELLHALSYKENSRYRQVDEYCSLLEEWRDSLHKSKSILTDCHVILTEIAKPCPDLLPDRRLAAEELRALGKLIVEIRQVKPEESEFQVLLFRNRTSKTELPCGSDQDALTDIAGFLELPWRLDKHLIIAGFNEESFEYGALTDSFLPDRAKTHLGLRDRRFFYAVNVYQMKTLLEPRKNNGGNLHILFGSTSANGDVLKPARLLMQCSPEELPERSALLFSDTLLEENPSVAPDARPSLFFPRLAEPKPKMSITGFKAYIDSPFHYYFNRVLEAEVLDDRALELDNLQFGTMIHDVLQEFGDSPHKNSNNPAEIAGFCLKKLDALLARRLNSAKYGIPKLQAEIMEANLQYFAEAQAENSANGWRILFTEKDVSFQWNELFRKVFPDTPEESWRSEIAVRGKLDRIDCHEGNGAWRIVDYKTNKESKSPAAEHIGGGNTETDDWRVAYTDEKGKRRYWKDLQLPLYLCAVKYGLIPGISMDEKALIGAAYFNLPLAYTFTGIQVFNELNQLPGLCGSAVLCADNILRRIFVEHCSWPPGRPGNPLYDELASYIGPYSAEQFDPVFIEALSAGKGES